MKKFIAILGSTGSIGLTSLEVINKKKNYFKPYIFSANKNFNLICKQIKKYKPNFFIITNNKVFEKVKKKFKKKIKVKILKNFDSLKVKKKADITITAIPGLDGLKPTIQSTLFSKKILIANKESIICGWDLIKKNANKNNTKVIPVDSEHFSIYKLLEKIKSEEIDKIFITASGGPFLNYNKNKLRKVKPNDALKHPKWKMGKKISIDSATLMNKVLEVIEAQKIFNLSPEKINILVHPESLVHAIVKLKNGLTYLIYHQTSMLIPIANAIFDGDLQIEKLLKIKKKTKKIENFTFKTVNSKIFPTVKLIKEINKYPSAPIIVNAANEILVDQFLRENIDFLSIYRTIKTILNDRNYRKYAIKTSKSIDQIINIDNWTRKLTFKIIKKNYV